MKAEAISHSILFYGLFIFLFSIGITSRFPGEVIITAFILMGLSIIFLFIARLAFYKQKKFFKFGYKELDKTHRFFYFLSYTCLGIASFFVLLVKMN
jgi:hypothetical protein